jgi:hypothetical protein
MTTTEEKQSHPALAVAERDQVLAKNTQALWEIF